MGSKASDNNFQGVLVRPYRFCPKQHLDLAFHSCCDLMQEERICFGSQCKIRSKLETEISADLRLKISDIHDNPPNSEIYLWDRFQTDLDNLGKEMILRNLPLHSLRYVFARFYSE